MACQTANFRIGTSGGVTRMWEIKVQQYACGNEDVSGPPGCLQYYTGAKGNIEKYLRNSLVALLKNMILFLIFTLVSISLPQRRLT